METITKEKPTVTKLKGNKTTETIIGTAANKLAQGLKGLDDTVKAAKEIENIIEEGTLKVTNLEDQIVEVKLKLEQDKKNAKFDLDLAFKQDQEEQATKYLNSRGLITKTQEEWDKVINDYNNLKTDFDVKVGSEVGKARGMSDSKHSSEIQILNLEHRNKETENTAIINQLREQNKFLTEQVASWKSALESERTAGIERAKASSIGTLNVGTNK